MDESVDKLEISNLYRPRYYYARRAGTCDGISCRRPRKAVGSEEVAGAGCGARTYIYICITCIRYRGTVRGINDP